MADLQTNDNSTAGPDQPLPEELEVAVPPAGEENSVPGQNVRQVKIFCFKCQQKLDVTGLMPFAHINCPVCGTDLIIPKWFDNYLLEEPCGRGGMASVYRALDIALDREVAVKILNQEGMENTAAFLNEARTAATINHSSVIPIYTCGTFDHQAYMVMQFMNGGSLEQKLLLKKGSPLAIDDVLQWMHDVAEGLDYAAKHGIIHHDVKPGNIMLDNDGNAKIGDFGIADRKQAPDQAVKGSYGSPLYVSPEKVSTGSEDSSGDIYSLGATFYHLLTGVPPFQHENLEELLWARVRQNPVAPHQLRPGISPLISSLIMRMMNHSPEMRPGYEEIIRNLNVFLRSNDAATVVMHKEIPLPKGSAGGNSPNSTSSLRVKSPSAILKRRRSSIVRTDSGTTSEQDVKPLEKMVADTPVKNHVRPVSGKNGWLLVSLILTAACAAGFAAFSTVQFIQAFNFVP